VGYSITLPLNGASFTNLEAAGIDPGCVIELLQANRNRKSGIFRDLAFLHPTRKPEDVALCADCRWDHYFYAWTEELCQLRDIVRAIERHIDLDRQRYEIKWMKLRASPVKSTTLRFCDVPWPVRNSEKISSPKQLKKAEVLRFFFSRCIVLYYLHRPKRRLFPRQMVAQYRRTWNPKIFTRRMPWYSQRIPSFLTQQAAILEGVALIRRFLDEYEYDNWGVYETPDMGLTWPEDEDHQTTEVSRSKDLAYFNPNRWLGKDQQRISSKFTLGTMLALQTTAYIGFAQRLTS
jgi:hypothetical protein